MSFRREKGQILILGGGFAGGYTAVHLERELAGRNDVEVMIVTKENFLLFTPMLHEIAAGDVDLTDIVQPLRKLLRRTQVLVGEIEMIDVAKKKCGSRTVVRHTPMNSPTASSCSQSAR